MSTPAIILINPQLGENIGACARAMHNFGLHDLRLVKPRDGWPNQMALDVAKKAKYIIENADIFQSTKDAVKDIKKLYATTARPRDMVKDVITPNQCAEGLQNFSRQTIQSAIMFGPERSGMSNDDILLADSIVTIPTGPEYTSLNLAQAVSIMCYEYFTSANINVKSIQLDIAKKEDIILLLQHLQSELDKRNFFSTDEIRPTMVRNISNIFTRNNLSSNEVQTLRGIIKCLTKSSI